MELSRREVLGTAVSAIGAAVVSSTASEAQGQKPAGAGRCSHFGEQGWRLDEIEVLRRRHARPRARTDEDDYGDSGTHHGVALRTTHR